MFPTSTSQLDGLISASMRSAQSKEQETELFFEYQSQQQTSLEAQPEDTRTVGEYALHHLFNLFVRHANRIIDACVQRADEYYFSVHSVCAPGVDPGLDQLIGSLGHIAQRNPNPLIDTLLVWRSKMSEMAQQSKPLQTSQQSSSPRPVTALTATVGELIGRRNPELKFFDHPEYRGQDSINHDAAVQNVLGHAGSSNLADCRDSVSLYLICRVLVNVLRRCEPNTITTGLFDRLLEMLYYQLKNYDPSRLGVWRICSELLGIMSDMDMTKVTEVYVNELATNNRDIERTEILIYSLQHIPVKPASPELFSRSCDFLVSIAKLSISHPDQNVKIAYCQLLEIYLLPIAADSSPNMTTHDWSEFHDLLFPRIGNLINKPRHWLSVYPLYTLLLCTATRDVFFSHWSFMINMISAKLKDRPTKATALRSLCQVVWTYLFRHIDSAKNQMKKIEDILRIALPSGKKTHLTTEDVVAEPLILLIRMIGYRYPDMCFRNVIFSLVNGDSILSSGKDLKIEHMDVERLYLGIRAFLAILNDHVTEKRPPFPGDADSLPHSYSVPPPLSNVLFDNSRQKQNLESPIQIDRSRLSDTLCQYYARFSQVLGKLTVLSDDMFGGQSDLDEKFGAGSPKTPITEAFSFARRDDASSMSHRQAYYDLLHVLVKCFPQCLSGGIPLGSMTSLLCTGASHAQTDIAASSVKSLKLVARLGYAQEVALAFARFIFNFDVQNSSLSELGMLCPSRIETTVSLYVELVGIWVEELKRKINDEVSSLSAAHYHDEIEGHGIYLLCSQSKNVRSQALTVQKLVVELDRAAQLDRPRIIKLLENDYQKIFDVRADVLRLPEQSRLASRRGKTSILLELCTSDVSYETTLWTKLFPNIIRVGNETSPAAVGVACDLACSRLVQMHPQIFLYAEYSQLQTRTTPSATSPVLSGAFPKSTIEQWMLYLIMACTTLNNATIGTQYPKQVSEIQSHSRKNSSKDGRPHQNKVTSARSLFASIIPLLSAGPEPIRYAIVSALGSINKHTYRTLLESLQYAVTTCNEEAKVRIGTHHRSPSMPSNRTKQTDRLRTEVTHVYKVTSHFLLDPDINQDQWIISIISTYIRDLRLFLSDPSVQNDPKLQGLRFHFCGLLASIFEITKTSSLPNHQMPFESRKSAFSLMEEWCGYSPSQPELTLREKSLRSAALSSQDDDPWSKQSEVAIEIEKQDLRNAALNGMATLCAGPVCISTPGGTTSQFNVDRMLAWINTLFHTPIDKNHEVGRRALLNLITYNQDMQYLMEKPIEMCYLSESPKTLESYMDVVSQVLIENERYPVAFWRLLGAIVFTLGNPERRIRIKSAELLKTLEERQGQSSRPEDFEIKISDRTAAVYKLVQFQTSMRLAHRYPELALTLFSGFSLHFERVQPDTQRNMVGAILPWIEKIELYAGPTHLPTPSSYMVLANLFDITIRSSTLLPNEIQALWQSLATGTYPGNVQLVLDFIISLCLEHRDQHFVQYARKVVVFLAMKEGPEVMEFFLLRITPRTMVYNERRESMILNPPNNVDMPYVVDLSTVLPLGNKSKGLSLGHLSMIFLVDLVVSPVIISFENVVKLIHVSLLFWDHPVPAFHEEARDMLVHLIYEVLAPRRQDSPDYERKEIEGFAESIRRGDPGVSWEYHDCGIDDDTQEPKHVSSAMLTITEEIIKCFLPVYEDLIDVWAKEALNFATVCPVRHLACRSFQVFRCISTSLDSKLLVDVLGRLANTIAEQQADLLSCSLEILITLRIVIKTLNDQDILRYPQLFWTTCACLETIYEREYMECIAILEKILEKINLNDTVVITRLLESKPLDLEGQFSGIQELLYQGLKSRITFDRSFKLMHKLTTIPSNEIVGGDARLLFTTLANLPVFLYYYELPNIPAEVVERACLLGRLAGENGYSQLWDSMLGFTNRKYQQSQDFLCATMGAIRAYYFQAYDVQILIFLMSVLTNPTPWLQVQIMRLLSEVLSDMDMCRPEIACYGFDALSPLFRLLHTDLSHHALEVMDRNVSICANPMERCHLRMSMMSSSAPRATRREFEDIDSLYGIPEPSGWSVPCPTVRSASTRGKVQAVFHTFAEFAGVDVQPSETNADSDAEEYDESYFPPMLRANTIKSADTQIQGKANMSDLIQRLDSLDDFFDEADLGVGTFADSVVVDEFDHPNGDSLC